MSTEERVDPTRSVGYLAHLIVRQSRRLLREKLADVGVVPGQLPALTHLYFEDGLTQSELARRARVEQPTMAQTIKRMVRDGLLELRPDPDDGRKVRIHVSARGRAVRPRVLEASREVNAMCLAGLDDGVSDSLLQSLETMVENLESS